MPDPYPSLETTAKGPLVLLYYDGYERKAKPGMLGGLISQAHRFARYAKKTLCRQQVRTGFYTAFLGLENSLRAVGCDVRVNDFEAARKRPHYPIGIGGYPSVIPKLDFLPNPRIFGPGDFGMPDGCAAVVADARFRTLIQPSDWFCNVYRPYAGDKMFTWFAGIDTAQWPDMSARPKDLDFVIYDKIRWHREARVPAVLERVKRHLDAKGLRYAVLRYGHHHHSEFMRGLERARALIFLCEHETQGLAYQEALSCNVPVLAWDEGELVDPALKPFLTADAAVSSVPYFDGRCGMTFPIARFEETCGRFLEALPRFAPRAYVEAELSLTRAGERYLKEYARIAGGA